MAAAALVALAVLVWWTRRPVLVVVNTTADDGISVLVDGSTVASNVARAPREAATAVQRVRVGAGVHRIEARDRSGKVVEVFEAELRGGGPAYLYAPAHPPETCFFVQRDEYRTDATAPASIGEPIVKLDPKQSFWPLAEPIDFWFQDSPSDITVQKDKAGENGSVVRRALRQAPCDDPAFAP